MIPYHQLLATEGETLALGSRLAAGLEAGMVIYLTGDLGAGKTTLARGILRGMGYRDRVKSPTFTLVEVYKLSKLYLHHFDFYRFKDPNELEEAGLREYFGPDAICLVEWPEKAAGLPAADVTVSLRIAGSGRHAELTAQTEGGRRCLERIGIPN